MLVTASEIAVLCEWLLGENPFGRGCRSSAYKWRQRLILKLGPDYDIAKPRPNTAERRRLCNVVSQAIALADGGELPAAKEHWHLVVHVQDHFRAWGNKSWPPEIFVSKRNRPTKFAPLTFGRRSAAECYVRQYDHVIRSRFGIDCETIVEPWWCTCQNGTDYVQEYEQSGEARPSGRRVELNSDKVTRYVGGQTQIEKAERALGAFMDDLSDAATNAGFTTMSDRALVAKAIFDPDWAYEEMLRAARTWFSAMARTATFKVDPSQIYEPAALPDYFSSWHNDKAEVKGACA